MNTLTSMRAETNQGHELQFLKVRIVLTILMSVCMSTGAFSQNILTSTIEWKSNSTFDATSGTAVDENTRIVSSPTQITWYDSKNTVKQTIDIESAEGSWTNVSNNGAILFKGTSGSFSGIVQFIKASGTQRIRIHLVHEDESTIYDLTITDVNTL